MGERGWCIERRERRERRGSRESIPSGIEARGVLK
jgi:hypothetical protein